MLPTVRVQAEPFDVGHEMAALTGGRTDIGGIGCFVGTVRGGPVCGGTVPNDGGAGQVSAMTLEHYPGMTERAMGAIAAEAIDRWQLLACTLVHRTGRLLPGEPIVLVLAAAAHRAAALDATAFLIDWLKTKAPFWKKETFTDGTERWVDARADDDATAARWSSAASRQITAAPTTDD